MSYQEDLEQQVEIQVHYIYPKGARHSSVVASFCKDPDTGISYTLCGFPPCPICNTILSLNPYYTWNEDTQEPDSHWTCSSCGTIWNTIDLIKIVEGED